MPDSHQDGHSVFNASIEGKPARLWPGASGVGTYRAISDAIRENGYPGFALS